MKPQSRIQYFFEDTNTIDYNKARLNSWIQSTIKSETQMEAGLINIIFCSDQYLLDINIQYLNHNYYTDIITFPYEEPAMSGDLFISVDRVHENSQVMIDSFDNELHRVIIHGILHLCGYNDKTADDKTVMREKENYYLKKLEAYSSPR